MKSALSSWRIISDLGISLSFEVISLSDHIIHFDFEQFPFRYIFNDLASAFFIVYLKKLRLMSGSDRCIHSTAIPQ